MPTDPPGYNTEQRVSQPLKEVSGGYIFKRSQPCLSPFGFLSFFMVSLSAASHQLLQHVASSIKSNVVAHLVSFSCKSSEKNSSREAFRVVNKEG